MHRNIVLRFDLRTAGHCPDSHADRVSAAVGMAAWADRQAVDVVGLSEHHNSSDGFLASPLTLAAMIVARTRRVMVSVSALLVPLHHPVRLAEEIAMIDQLAGGRFVATAGLGYRPEEYALFGVDWAQRGAVFDEKLSVLTQLLSGDSLNYEGQPVQLVPAACSPVSSIVMIGGNSRAAARRAARFGLLFCPAIDDPALEQAYRDACETEGFRHGATIFPRYPSTTLLSEDPEKTWREVGEYLLFDATAYGRWHHPNRRAYAESFAHTLEELKSEGKYRVLTPEQAIAVIAETGSLHLAPLTGGVPLDTAWRSLQLFEDQVQPYIGG